MRFVETPIEPHVSSPSVASMSTLIVASEPFVSSRMRTLKFVSQMSARCGCASVRTARSAASSAWTGPLPSA